MTRRLRIALLAGAGFLLLQLGWIVSVAPHFGIDEFDHALRASSVAQGHWEPGDDLDAPALARGDLIPVRADVAKSVRTSCQLRPYTRLYNCVPKQELGDGEVLIASGAARYNPTFYAVVGVAAAPFQGNTNLYAMRIVAALVACVLFTLTVWLAAARARTRWPVLAVILAALPTTIYSTAVAAPNGIEMVAGMGTWVALLAVADRTTDRTLRRPAYLLLALFTAVLVNLHTLGAVWLALIAVGVAILHGPIATARALLPRDLLERAAAGATGFAIAFELVWVALSGNTDTSVERTVFAGSGWPYVFNGLLLWPLQAIGAFPMRDNEAPAAVYAIALVLLGTVAVLAMRRTRLRSRVALAFGFIAVMSWVVPSAMTLATFDDIGNAWQGRYVMPFAVGLLVLAGQQLDASRRRVPRTAALASVLVLGLVVAQVISQVAVVDAQRLRAGLAEGTGWDAPSTVLLVVLAVVAFASWNGALAGHRGQNRDTTDAASEPTRQEVPA